MKLAFEGSHFLLLLLPYFNGSARRFVFAQLLALNGCRAERRCIDVLTLCGILVAVLNFVDDVTAATSFLVSRPTAPLVVLVLVERLHCRRMAP